jgi:hypothetical protein
MATQARWWPNTSQTKNHQCSFNPEILCVEKKGQSLDILEQFEIIQQGEEQLMNEQIFKSHSSLLAISFPHHTPSPLPTPPSPSIFEMGIYTISQYKESHSMMAQQLKVLCVVSIYIVEKCYLLLY